MPRPNHDLPNLLLGGIKDYARREDISRDEAHADLLARGLRDVGILSAVEEDAVHEVVDTDESGEKEDKDES